MSRAARSFSPRRSKRARTSPARLRSTASGLARISVRSTAMRPTSLAGLAAPARRTLRFADRDGGVDVVLDRRLAERAHLPRGLEGLPAARARLAELRRADGTDEELLIDLGATYRAAEVARAEPPFHRLDLELALPDILEVLGRAEQHVDQRPDEWDDADRSHDADDQLVRDAAARVLEHPVDGRDPEHDREEDREVAGDVPRRRVEEVVHAAER